MGVGLAIGWAAVVALSIRLHSRYILVEILAYAICGLVLVQLGAIRRFLATMPGFHRSVFVVMLGSMILGQVADRPHRTFPFVVWNMYSVADQTRDLSYVQLQGRRKDGSGVRLRPAELFPSLKRTWVTWEPPPFSTPMPLTAGDREVWASATRHYNDVLIALGRRYNRDHPDNTIDRVEVIRMRSSSRRSGPPDEREIAWTVEVGAHR
jgi:hypothetical protein